MNRFFTIPLLGLLLLIGLPSVSAASSQGRIAISSFTQEGIEGWQEKEFDGTTRYRLVEADDKGKVLAAVSDGTASGLVKEQRINIAATPFLNWSWKVEQFPAAGDERTKTGDDYGARLYVIFSTGPWFWDTRALNYVWSNSEEPGVTWPNAFTDKACMLAVRAGMDQAGQWVKEKRNVREDIHRCFGLEVDAIEAVALMSDSDNTDSQAKAMYGEIFFSEK